MLEYTILHTEGVLTYITKQRGRETGERGIERPSELRTLHLALALLLCGRWEVESPFHLLLSTLFREVVDFTYSLDGA
jgi:hypothetical protein